MILVVLGEHEWREGRGFDAVGRRGVAPGIRCGGAGRRAGYDALGRDVALGIDAVGWGVAPVALKY